jgi:hypothetical protein
LNRRGFAFSAKQNRLGMMIFTPVTAANRTLVSAAK